MESYLFIQISTEVHSAVEEKYLNLLLLEKVTPSFDVAALALVDLEVELLQHQIQTGDCNPTEEDHVSSLQDSQHNHEHRYVVRSYN